MRGSGRVLCQPSAPIIVAPLRFLDIETSGLRADRGGRITELALLSGTDPLIEWTLPELYDIGSKDHDSDVRSLLVRVIEESDVTILVAHNAPFDLRFLAYECRRLGVDGLSVQVIDTLALARKSNLDVSDHRLETLSRAFKLDVPGPMHTAIVDAKVTRALFDALVGVRDLETLGDAGLRRLSWSTA